MEKQCHHTGFCVPNLQNSPFVLFAFLGQYLRTFRSSPFNASEEQLSFCTPDFKILCNFGAIKKSYATYSAT